MHCTRSRPIAFFLAVCGLLIAAALLVSQPAAAQKRAALVVGNSAYTHSTPLANPANDAGDMADALKELGFEVVLGLDLDKRGFDLKVRDFARALADADTALFFYAGHGLQVAGRNYLVPVDAQLANERDLDFEAVGLDLVMKQMELEREGKTNIVFLDACRDNPLARNLARSMGTRSASIGRGLAQVQTGVGTFIAYSTQPGNVALDGAGRNSPFTAALAKGVKAPGRSLTGVMIEVRKEVLASTSGKQVPWDHSALTGDFYFHLASAPETLKGPLQQAHADVMAIAGDEVAKRKAAALLVDGERAVRSGDRSAALRLGAELDDLREELAREYTLTIVSRPGEVSGVWRQPPTSREVRNYYLIVEALAPGGRRLSLPVRNEETDEVETVAKFGVRVSQATFDAVVQDKSDDGIIQRNRFGVKRRGTLAVDYDMPFEGGFITKW
jgi:hypothetical protein